MLSDRIINFGAISFRDIAVSDTIENRLKIM